MTLTWNLELEFISVAYSRGHHWKCGYTQPEAAIINHLHALIATFMFGCSGNQIYGLEIKTRVSLVILIDHHDLYFFPLITFRSRTPSSIVFSLHFQVACTWKDVKSLRQDLERNSSPGIMQFRSRLLQAISQLQVRASTLRWWC